MNAMCAADTLAPPTAPKQLRPRHLRVCWRGPNPSRGDWLASASGKIAYRIDAVATLHDAVLSERPRLKLTVQILRIADVPAGVALIPWSITGPVPASARDKERLRIRSLRHAAHSEQIARVRTSREFVEPVRKRRGDVALTEWKDGENAVVSGYRKACPLRRLARRHSSSITVEHIRAADLVRREYDIASMGLTPGGAGLRVGAVHTAPQPMTGHAGGAQAQIKAAKAYRRALGCIGPARVGLFVWVVINNRDLASWRDAQMKLLNRPVHPEAVMGKLVSILDDLVEHYATEIREAEQRGELVV